MLTLITPRRLRTRGITLALAAGGIGILPPASAEAHFQLDAPACWLSQDSVGGPQKNGPCAAMPNTALGDPTGTPTGKVTAIQAGQMVTVTVTVTIPHPGWWRIALMEGASSTQTLASIPDPKAQAGTTCTPAIMANPVWSPTQPVLADGLPAGSTATTMQRGTQTFHVAIPQNATCSAAKPCTVQAIMVMTDHPADDCYYHHCADITVSGGAGSSSSSSGGAGSSSSSSGGAGSSSSSSGGAADASVSDASVGADDGAASGSSSGGTAGSSSSSGAGSSTSSSSSGAESSSSGAVGSGASSGPAGGSSSGQGGSSGSGGAAEDAASGTGAPASSSGGCALAPSSGDGTRALWSVAGLFAFAAVRRRRQRN